MKGNEVTDQLDRINPSGEGMPPRSNTRKLPESGVSSILYDTSAVCLFLQFMEVLEGRRLIQR
jgi:hypothetical protein